MSGSALSVNQNHYESGMHSLEHISGSSLGS